MPENPTSMPEPSGESTSEVVAGKNDANVPETPAEPLGGAFIYPGDDDLAGSPVPPIASPGGRPVYPGDDDLAGIPTTPVAPSGGRPVYPDNTIGRQHIRPNSGCLYRWPECLFRFRICHDLFLYPRDGRIPHRHCAQDQRSDLLSADDCLCVR